MSREINASIELLKALDCKRIKGTQLPLINPAKIRINDEPTQKIDTVLYKEDGAVFGVTADGVKIDLLHSNIVPVFIEELTNDINDIEIEEYTDGTKRRYVTTANVTGGTFAKSIPYTQDEKIQFFLKHAKVFNVPDGVGISGSNYYLLPNGEVTNGAIYDNWTYESEKVAQKVLDEYRAKYTQKMIDIIVDGFMSDTNEYDTNMRFIMSEGLKANSEALNSYYDWFTGKEMND